MLTEILVAVPVAVGVVYLVRAVSRARRHRSIAPSERRPLAEGTIINPVTPLVGQRWTSEAAVARRLLEAVMPLLDPLRPHTLETFPEQIAEKPAALIAAGAFQDGERRKS